MTDVDDTKRDIRHDEVKEIDAKDGLSHAHQKEVQNVRVQPDEIAELTGGRPSCTQQSKRRIYLDGAGPLSISISVFSRHFFARMRTDTMVCR